MQFTKATKQQSRLRLALYGPSGSGKTYTALLIGSALGKPVAVIDTERGSASKYAGDVADFEKLELPSFEPAKYIAAIRLAAEARFPTLIIDSLTHAWAGSGGLLDQADAKGGKFDAWKSLTPQQNDLIDAILSYPGDVIVTMRAKTEYVVEQVEKNGRTINVPKKVGLAPIQRAGVEYEFDIAASMDMDNTMHVEKSRCPALSGAMIRKPGAAVAKALRDWLGEGAPTAAPAAPKSEPRPTEGGALSLDLLRSLIGTASFVDALKSATETKVVTRGEAKELWAEHKAKVA